MNLTSKYKHLVVSGCSFTHNNHSETHCVWSNTLAHWAGMTIDNLAIPGAGNTHIKNSVLLHLENTKPKVDETLILVMWSGPERIDWITDRNSSKFYTQYPFHYEYTSENELTLGGSWWTNPIKTHLDKTLVEYSKYQNNSSLALNTWIQIQDLENYLKINQYNYYFLSWFDYSDQVDNTNRWIDLDRELDKINLKIDRTQWLVNDPACSMGRWGLNHPEFLYSDNFHLTWQGHEAWLKEVLIPELIEKNELNYTYRI